MIKLSNGVKPEEIKVETELDNKATSLLKGVLAASALIGGGAVATPHAFAEVQTSMIDSGVDNSTSQNLAEANLVNLGSNTDSTDSVSQTDSASQSSTTSSSTSASDSAVEVKSDSISVQASTDATSTSEESNHISSLSTSETLVESNSTSTSQALNETLASQALTNNQITTSFFQLFGLPQAQALPDHEITFNYFGGA